MRGGQRRDAGHLVLDGGRANLAFVGASAAARRRVDHQVHLAVLHVVDQVRAAFLQLGNLLDGDARFTQELGRAARRDQAILHLGQGAGDRRQLGRRGRADAAEHVRQVRLYVDRVPLAPRLSTLEGKTIFLVDIGWGGPQAAPSIYAEMKAWFAQNMPSVKVEIRSVKGSYMQDQPELWKEISEKGHAAMIGISG